jgi:hypothetical protein
MIHGCDSYVSTLSESWTPFSSATSEAVYSDGTQVKETLLGAMLISPSSAIIAFL